MFCPFSFSSDDRFSEQSSETADWFNVEGDLDDFIFFDPAGMTPEPSSK